MSSSHVTKVHEGVRRRNVGGASASSSFLGPGSEAEAWVLGPVSVWRSKVKVPQAGWREPFREGGCVRPGRRS